MTLEFARSNPVEPGTNQRGEQADTTWLFLLPSLELGEVVVVGSAPSGTRVALEALAERVSVARSVTNAPPADRADLVYVAPRHQRRLARDEAAIRWLSGVLESGGSVYLAPRPRRGATRQLDLARRLKVGASVTIGATTGDEEEALAAEGPSAWLIPATAPPLPRWAQLPVRALRAARRILLRVARRPGASTRMRVSEPETSVGIRGTGPLPTNPVAGTGVLLRGSNPPGTALAPRYLVDTAEAAGKPLHAAGWRLAPPRGYRSQKVIFFARLEDGSPVVVKLTQEPRFNRLLENEATALDGLARMDLGESLTVPALYFRTTHGGVTVVAQAALEGRAFVNVATPGPQSAHAEAVLQALVALATKTKRPASDMGEAVLEIVNRYRSLYEVAPGRGRRLEEYARRLGSFGDALPTVFMHGDATVFNVLVGDDSRIGLVDWENAEEAGMPLWDLFMFRQAHATWTAEAAGYRYTPSAFAADFLGDENARPPASPAILTSCDELGLPADSVEPLMHTWLAWHAVREARQMPPDKLASGFYHRVLAGALSR